MMAALKSTQPALTRHNADLILIKLPLRFANGQRCRCGLSPDQASTDPDELQAMAAMAGLEPAITRLKGG